MRNNPAEARKGNQSSRPYFPQQKQPANLTGWGKIHGTENREEQMHPQGQPITDDHAVAATLPIDHSAVDDSGHMDHHRKPIVSIHGKDVQEHELDHDSAA